MDLSKNDVPEESEVYKEDRTWKEQFLKTEGRLNRLRYLKRNLVLLLVWLLSNVLIALIFGDYMGNLSRTGTGLVSVISVVMLFPTYCLDVRRLHDMDKDSTIAKICFVLSLVAIFIADDDPFNPSSMGLILSLVFCLIALYMLFVPGTKGANKYGADPLG